MKKPPRKSALRQALRGNSPLQSDIRDGLEALKRTDRNRFDQEIRADFKDSLALDEAMSADYPEESRWDYLLSHAPSANVVAVESHVAQGDQISAVIRKRSAARDQLRNHLQENARVSRWLWVASGKVLFADTEKVRRRLDQNGITFVGRTIMKKHLP